MKNVTTFLVILVCSILSLKDYKEKILVKKFSLEKSTTQRAGENGFIKNGACK